jgi:hypothetical protein
MNTTFKMASIFPGTSQCITQAVAGVSQAATTIGAIKKSVKYLLYSPHTFGSFAASWSEDPRVKVMGTEIAYDH